MSHALGHPGKDKILSIGGVRVSGGAIAVAESLDIQLVQEAKPRQQDIAVHGILPSTHAGQKNLEEALACFLDWIGPAVLVGHHVRFDTTMINNGLKQCGGGNLLNISLDTAELAMRVNGKPICDDRENWSLDTLAGKFEIPLHDRHTAAGDAFITGILLLKLLERLERRGVHTLKSLLYGK